MDIILIPGLWLDADSWADVTPPLIAAGRRVHPLTMPGTGAPASESSAIGMSDWVNAVVDVIDRIDGRVVLVGHSGGGNVVWGAADARPGRVARVVFVDTAPPASGFSISEFDVVDGVVPFPGWDFFDEPDVHDLDAATRARTAPLTKSVPARVPTDPIELSNPGRFAVPVTLLMGGIDRDAFEQMLTEWGAALDEYRALEDVEVITLGSGHWPQFSMPQRLAEQILVAVDR
ncbi:alpha/beta fold hydrolase [Microbacterium sp. W4I4]|uniref:alpha/beta fold hydrolase n=1 Tax=Microbacterium sp. W4I4 TaxID=3042295 RepID=UPI0027D8B801|nr:alpha/beta hydrolase [Microbacterium sp. W4I4]